MTGIVSVKHANNSKVNIVIILFIIIPYQKVFEPLFLSLILESSEE
jgi:hypothetical protein